MAKAKAKVTKSEIWNRYQAWLKSNPGKKQSFHNPDQLAVAYIKYRKGPGYLKKKGISSFDGELGPEIIDFN